MTDDGRYPRHLHPVEPPYDPEYDARTPSHDPDAERALLRTLLEHPDVAATLATEIDPNDFYRPEHETIWATWHRLNTNDGTPPDNVTLNAALVTSKDQRAIRAFADVLTAPATFPLLDQYVRLVRNHARIRAAQTAHHKLGLQLNTADPDTLDQVFGDALDTIEHAALRFGPTTDPNINRTGLADLTWILAGVAPTSPPPVYGMRTDGTALFYKGRVNGIFGDPECGKTWLAQVAGIEALNAGGTFSFLDVDHNGQDHTAARLMLLGANINHLADPDRFRYYEPEDSEQLTAAITDITERTPDVVVLDSIGEILPMLGVKSVDNDEVTAALRRIAMPPAKAGSCVITIDHLPKGAEARATGYAIGGTAKKRAMDGSYLRVESRTQPTPGGIGRMTIRIEKDRTGELRKTSGGGYAGDFTLDSTQPNVTTWTIGRAEQPKNADGSFRPTRYMDKVATYVADHPECSGRDIEQDIDGAAARIRAALHILVAEGHIARTKGPNRSWLHSLTVPYREAEDDLAHPQL